VKTDDINSVSLVKRQKTSGAHPHNPGNGKVTQAQTAFLSFLSPHFVLVSWDFANPHACNCLLFIVISAKSTNFTTNTRYHVESSVDEPHRLPRTRAIFMGSQSPCCVTALLCLEAGRWPRGWQLGGRRPPGAGAAAQECRQWLTISWRAEQHWDIL